MLDDPAFVTLSSSFAKFPGHRSADRFCLIPDSHPNGKARSAIAADQTVTNGSSQPMQERITR
jgi:hypothetical protein